MSIQNIKELFSTRVQESMTSEDPDSPNAVSKTNCNVKNNSLFVSLKESDVGITEYLSDCKGFDGVIKQRFSDFHVHEIDNDGNVVYLTNTNVPEIQQVVKTINLDVIPNGTWEELEKLRHKYVECVKIDVTDYAKDKRREIHEAIKLKFGSLFTSNTVEVENKKNMIISHGKDNTRVKPWYSNLGAYLHFVVFKQNLDTVQAINLLANYLKTKPSNLTYAGNKDKRAVTSQWVSMWHLDAHRLKTFNKKLSSITVGNFTYKSFPLQLGSLKGNLFDIVLRNVKGSDEVINISLNAVKENGFINYFGLQRFGNCVEIPTYEIGKALVKGDFKCAVELILKPRKGKMQDDLREARKIWWETRDADKAFKCLRSKDKTIEGKLLAGLAKLGQNAYINALDCIPRNIRLLYLHAFQSLLWNKIVSRRISQFGKSVVEGDLVLVEENLESEEKDSEYTNCDTSISKVKVRPLLKNEIKKFKITDIVYPLPGYNITYPNNIIKEWYCELLEENGLSSENLNQTVKKYAISGAYRHIVKKVKDMSWSMCYYSEPEENLILTDLDKLNNTFLDNTKTDKKYKAVVLRFTLDSSTYATMALREILKIDTSCSHQASLNSYSTKRACENEDDESNKKSKIF